jgi:hypothetical protein
MTTIEQPAHRINDAEERLWFGQTPGGWGDTLRTIDPSETRDAAAMIAAAGLHWAVEQHQLEVVIEGDGHPLRLPVPRHVANVRSDTQAVLGVVGEGYEPLQNRAAFAFCDGITDSGRAHWIGAGATRGGARVHALMRLDREIRIGGAEGEEVLPLLCFRNGHDGGLSVTVSVAPFRLACLNRGRPSEATTSGSSARLRRERLSTSLDSPRRCVWLSGERGSRIGYGRSTISGTRRSRTPQRREPRRRR